MQIQVSDHAKQRLSQFSLYERYRWVLGLRPMVAAEYVARVALPTERRRIVTTDMGINLYVDPFSHAGMTLMTTGVYEPETMELMQTYISPGDRCLDIGANEGILSAFMGKLVGSKGLIVSVEPQSRLRDIIEINLRVNDTHSWHIFQNAVGGEDGSTTALHLWPFMNSGASGIFRKAKMGKTSETVEFISPEAICSRCEVDGFDFVKVDVEGFEHQVVAALLPLLKSRKIKRLLLDYHAVILRSQNIDPKNIHETLVGTGMSPQGKTPENLEGYQLYCHE